MKDILKMIFGSLITKKIAILVLEAIASKTTRWHWDDAVVDLVKSLIDHDDAATQKAFEELIKAVETDYKNYHDMATARED